MKNTGLIIFLGTVLCLILSSCGIPNPPGEKQIAQSVPDDIRTVSIDNPLDRADSDVYDMEVKSVIIDKRQTNEKEDIAYCVIELENDYYKFEKHIVMNYTYYDKGGWILESHGEYEPTTWKLKDCPFSGEDVATMLDEYNIVNINDMTIDTDSNTVEFTFEINDVYENVTSEGTMMVNFLFDGSGWTYDINTDNIDLSWDILGHWYSGIYSGLYLDINELNDEYVSVEIIYEDTAEDALSGERSPILDTSDERYWHLKTQSTNMWEGFTEDGEPYLWFQVYFGAWSDTWNIYIYRDSATARVRMYPNTRLFRVESNPFIPDTSGAENNSNTLSEDEEAWNSLISEYFDLMEVNNHEQIWNFMLGAGPYGDEVNIRGVPLKSYEINRVEHSSEFYASMHDELEDDIEMVRSEFAEYKPDLYFVVTDFAAVYVKADFDGPFLEAKDYKFRFIYNSGTWEMFYVDTVS